MTNRGQNYAAALAHVADLIVPPTLTPMAFGARHPSTGPVPQNAVELQEWVYTHLGVWINDQRVCEHHCAPLDAMAEAFFGTHPRMVWWASRGYGGKTFLLATLVLAEAILLGADVTLLGGSLEQSLRVSRYLNATPNLFLSHPNAPRQLLVAEPTKREILFQNGGRVLAIPASERSIRGLHPARLRADELDAFQDVQLWESAQGLAMPQAGVADQTLASSTWHQTNGPMTSELLLARQRGWPIFTWCHRESMVGGPPPSRTGWLLPDVIERKRASVSDIMWKVEYELQEPMVYGDRVYVAFSHENVDSALVDTGGELVGGVDFNRCPLFCVLGVEVGNQVHILDEIVIWNATTEDLAHEIQRRCCDPDPTSQFAHFVRRRKPEEITLYPDASGRQGSTKTGQTDFSILESFGFNVDAPLANPRVAERNSAVNSALKTAAGTHRLRFHPRCRESIRCLSQMPYKRGTSIPDKTTGLDHGCDAVAYLVMAKIPLVDTTLTVGALLGI